MNVNEAAEAVQQKRQGRLSIHVETLSVAVHFSASLLLLLLLVHQPLRIVWLEGRRLLTLLDGFFTQAAADVQPAAEQASPAAAAAAELSVVDAAAAAAEVAAMLSSYLQSFMDGACTEQQQQQQQQGGSVAAEPPCCILVAENVFGPHGAVTYMNRAQQQACLNPGRQAATRWVCEFNSSRLLCQPSAGVVAVLLAVGLLLHACLLCLDSGLSVQPWHNPKHSMLESVTSACRDDDTA